MTLPPYWWREADTLRAEYAEHGTFEAIRSAHPDNSASPRTMAEWWRRMELPALPRGPQAATVNPAEGGSDEWLLAALKKLGDAATVEEIADHCDVAPRRVRDSLAALGHKGYRVEQEGQQVVLHKFARPTEMEHKLLFDGDTYRFGIASDVHLNSKHCRLEELHIAYDRFRKSVV